MQEILVINAAIILAALALDKVLGEPKRWHPLVGFGRCAHWLEATFNRSSSLNSSYSFNHSYQSIRQFLYGALTWLLAITPWVILAGLVGMFTEGVIYYALCVITLYWAIGAKSLREHAQAVQKPLSQNNLSAARDAVAMLVSRDTSALDETQMSRAVSESVLENAHDSVVGPIVWFLLLGIPGVVLFRLANTLDAMWGYRNTRFEFFGKFAARADDILGWPSARCTVFLFALQQPKALLAAWSQGRQWYSPNAGPVMAAGATAANIQLGGSADYHGVQKTRPTLGTQTPADAQGLNRALRVAEISYYLIPAILLLAALVIAVI